MGGTLHPPAGRVVGLGATKKKSLVSFLVVFCIRFLAFFQHMVFADGFIFSFKELGLLTNLGY